MQINTVLNVLKKRIEKAGSQKQVAQELGISEGYLSDILQGNRMISDTIALKLGFKRQDRYIRIPAIPITVSKDGKIHGDQIGEALNRVVDSGS